MRKAILSTIAALALLAGCEAPNNPTKTKWEGPPYRLTFGTPPTKPNTAGLALPPIYFAANPEAVQTRANLVMRIDTTGVKKPGKPGKITDQLLLMPTDIANAHGALSDTYLTTASTELAKMLGYYCMKGKIKVNVALVKSSIMMGATDAQVDNHRLSDWQPIEVDFNNPHPKC